jgi:hypothetical protein
MPSGIVKLQGEVLAVYPRPSGQAAARCGELRESPQRYAHPLGRAGGSLSDNGYTTEVGAPDEVKPGECRVELGEAA